MAFTIIVDFGPFAFELVTATGGISLSCNITVSYRYCYKICKSTRYKCLVLKRTDLRVLIMLWLSLSAVTSARRYVGETTRAHSLQTFFLHYIDFIFLV